MATRKPEEDEEEEEEDRELGFGDGSKKLKTGAEASASSSSKRGSIDVGGGETSSCQVENCGTDLTSSRRYYKRHKVCELHAKAPAAVVAGIQQRFCQQCSRFHGLLEFDDTKKSCRKRLAGHNQRRRKNMFDIHGESSTS